MAEAEPLTEARIRRRRVAAQLLHRPRASSPADVVGHLLGIQAQDLPASRLAFRARIEGLTAGRVDRARLQDRSIVRTWAMRGTLHLIPAEDHAWLVPLTTGPRISNAERRLRQEGVPADQAERGMRAMRDVLRRQGPLPRGELADRLRVKGIRTHGQAIAHLVWLAAANGIACYGPELDGEPALVLTNDWLRGQPRTGPSNPAAELAVRYLRAHAPAAPADLIAWSGLRAGAANRAWRDIADRLVEVQTERGPMWSLRGSRPAEPEEVVRLLPAFDEFLLGWRDRDLIASASDWKRINRGGGWLHPVLLVDGRAAGTWRSDHRTADPDVQPFGRLAASVRRAIATERREIERFRPISAH